MLFLGVGCFTFGYALIWTGVERFRGNNVSLLQSLGFAGGEVNRVTGGSVSGSTDGQGTGDKSGRNAQNAAPLPPKGQPLVPGKSYGDFTLPKQTPKVLGIPVPDPFGLFS